MFLNRFSVQNKILATLAVPFLVILVAATVFAMVSIGNWRDANQVRDVTQFITQAEGLIGKIQNERGIGVQVVSGDEDARANFETAVDERGKALDQLDASFQNSSFDRIPDSAQQVLAEIRDVLRLKLEYSRDVALRGAATPQVLAENYDESVSLMLSFVEVLGNTSTDRDLSDAAAAYAAVYKYQDSVLSEKPLIREIMVSTKAGVASDARARDVALVVRQVSEDRATTLQQLTRSNIEGATSLQTLGPQYSAVRQLVGNASAGAVSQTLIDSWDAAATEEVEKITPIRSWLREAMESAATESANEARFQALLTLALMIVVLALSLTIAYVTSRSITTPLRHLARAADQVKTELPRLVEQMAVPGQTPDFELKPIKVESRDEVGQLAESFNAVNSTTIDVAREQAALRGSIAEMFVNVARRDHVLLNRQLGFLDELERAEEDPSTLANLFRLDHLATRMRRNSESLLVLAGIDSGRRIRDAMAISDVVRTASSEIEQYDRIQLNLQADPSMLGHNALNAAHLIAELLENATNFSEPHTPVEVTTATSKHFMTVTIRDYGLGMNAKDIDDANRKVASRSATDVVGVQRVGLFVVGRLADRLGVHVAFSRPSDGSEGTVVVLSFPYSLFVDQNSQALPQPTDPLTRENQEAAQNWVAPEPEVVREVDLNSLTDGTTTTGMPKRRISAAPGSEGFTPQFSGEAAPLASRTGAPAQAAPQQSSDLDEAAIVLPPLETPLAPVVSDANAPWQPATAPVVGSSGLPTRRVTQQPVSLEPEVLDVAPQAPEQRSAMFSSFRSFNPTDLQAESEGSEAQAAQNEADSQSAGLAFSGQELAGQESAGQESVGQAFGGLVDDSAAEAADLVGGGHEVSAPNDSAFSAHFTEANTGTPDFAQADSVHAESSSATHHASAFTAPSMDETQQFQPSFADSAEPALPSFEPETVVAHDAPPSFAPDLPQAVAESARSAHSAASGAEWAERFADLPTRASRAREARQTHTSTYTPEIPVPSLDNEKAEQFGAQGEEMWVPTFADEVVEPTVPALEAEAADAFYQPTVQLDQPLGAQQSHEHAYSDAQYGHEQAPQVAPVDPQQQYHAPAPAQEAFNPVVPPQGYGDAPVGVPAVGLPAAHDATQYGDFHNAPGIAREGNGYLNSSHPFSPFSAPSAVSPTDHSVVSPTPFADIVADTARTDVHEEPKRGFFARLFGKKPATKDLAHASRKQGPSASDFTVTSPAANFGAAQGISQDSATVAGQVPGVQGGAAAPQFGAAGQQPVAGGSYAPSFGSPGTGGQFGSAAPQADSHGNAERGGFAPISQFGAGPHRTDFGSKSQLSAHSAASAQVDVDLNALPAPAAEFGAQGEYVPTFEQGAPLGGNSFGNAFGSGEGTAHSPESSHSPTGADGSAHWDPPADFGQSAFALQSSIQEQAFAELSELSAYRPNAVAGEGTNLTRRVKTNIAGPLEDPSAQKISRDAAELRSRLSAFQSATARGRQDGISGASSEQGANASELPARVPDSVNQ